MSETVVTRNAVVANRSRILIGLAALLMAIGFCMCLGFIIDKPKDLLDLFAVWSAAWALFFLAHL